MPLNIPLLFLICMAFRLSLAYLVWSYPDWAQSYSLLALGPALGFLWMHFFSTRTRGGFGTAIWWDYLRVPHAALWAIAALYSYEGKSYAWVPLLLDPLIGLAGQILQRY